MSLLPFVLFACAPKEEADFNANEGTLEDTAAADTAADTDATSTAPDPELEYSGGACPALTEGKMTLESAGESRTLRVELPADPEGAPVLFAWHWLGGTADQITNYLTLDRVADDEGVIVVAPDSCCGAYEWQFTSAPEGNVDLAVFDDALACLHQQYDVDLDRIWATGMSAGGLWTTYLTMHRADRLAATAPMSGGTFASDYETPASPIPVLLTWGGPSDTYSGFSFDDANQIFSESLQEDGHFVIECVHDLGHNIPPEIDDYMMPFFNAHPRGVSPEPYADGLPSEFPSWCSIP